MTELAEKVDNLEFDVYCKINGIKRPRSIVWEHFDNLENNGI